MRTFSAACEFSRSAILWVNRLNADLGSRALASRAFICDYPGSGAKVPRWKYFRYLELADTLPPVANRPGFGHIAFAVDDVRTARDAVLAAGGAAVGTIEVVRLPGAGTITWTYTRDPEGNIIELQRHEPE